MEIRPAAIQDAPTLQRLDTHLPSAALPRLIRDGRVLVLDDGGVIAGWLRYSLFWCRIPFLDLLCVAQGHRGRGWGRRLMDAWEGEMRAQGHTHLMASTQANEASQHFYRKLGYQDAGGFFPPGEPFELILIKSL